jgi:hypothetical protein
MTSWEKLDARMIRSKEKTNSPKRPERNLCPLGAGSVRCSQAMAF